VKPVYLCLIDDLKNIKKKKLLLLNHPVPKEYENEIKLGRYRISPIFPILITQSEQPEFKGSHYVGFFFYQHAFQALGHLLNNILPERHKEIWFSHGLASIIIFSHDLDFLQSIKKIYKQGLRAFELWSLKDNSIVKINTWRCKPNKFDPSLLFLRDYSSLNSDLCHLLDEFQNLLNSAVLRSSQYIPTQLPVYEKVLNALNGMIEELLFLCDPTSEPPASLSQAAVILRKSMIERQKMINQRTGNLVQINSILSRVLSQAYSGIIPIFETSCPVRNFSFLGIGTAFLALSAFSSYIEQAFAEHPVDEVIYSLYSQMEGVDNTYINNFQEFINNGPEEWKKYQIDPYLTNRKLKPIMPKLVCFSGRQGFRETEYAVTCALPVLYSGDMAQWSIMTVSHELLHAHVRAILSILFPHLEGRSPNQTWEHYFGNFRGYFDEYRHEKKPTLSESIRNMILNYSDLSQYYSHLAETQVTGKRKKLSYQRDQVLLNDLRRDFNIELRMINEIIVHILDYNYFYNCNDHLYLGLLWESWTPVPVVLDCIDRYIYRSILVIMSEKKGTFGERFKLALSILHSELIGLLERDPDNILIEKAINCLEDDKFKKKIGTRTLAGIYLADIAKNFLVSTHIRTALLRKDENLYTGEDEENAYPFIYLLKVGEFVGERVGSPVAFLADRLQRALARDNKRTSEEEFYAAAWILLSCASAVSEGG
jgi:hypothetical protein